MTVMQSCLEMEKITDWSVIQTVRSLRSLRSLRGVLC